MLVLAQKTTAAAAIMKIYKGTHQGKIYPFMDGVRREYIKEPSGTVKEIETYYLCAFRFDLDKVAKSIDVSVEKKMKVNIICFDYQKKYIEAFLKTLNWKTHRVDVLSDSIESYKENYLL